MIPKRNKKIYTPFYQRLVRIKSQAGTHFLDFKKRELKHIADWIAENGEDGQILDMGCSSGFTTRQLADRFGSSRVHGADINWKSVNKCSERYDDLDFHHIDLDFYKTYRGKYGTVLLSHVIEHVNQPVALLNRVKTLLTENGKLIVSVPQERIRGDSAIPENFYNLLRLKFENVHRLKYSYKRLVLTLEAAGIRAVGHQYIHALWVNGNVENFFNHSLIIYTRKCKISYN
ncbi:MAG: class I SAM-dependent methyltransferase [Candidatus Marinimicrobia bacterium]|nr:class I SAM-dependent methyltransferase [Candidatus Neomarinimicrobiota bacterium]|tara:strand:+ start:3224 stop:3916 length:693 start_codon:yes stop_codon:yes gene_type:complete